LQSPWPGEHEQTDQTEQVRLVPAKFMEDVREGVPQEDIEQSNGEVGIGATAHFTQSSTSRNSYFEVNNAQF